MLYETLLIWALQKSPLQQLKSVLGLVSSSPFPYHHASLCYYSLNFLSGPGYYKEWLE